MSATSLTAVTEFDRNDIQAWMPSLDAWLLPDNVYSVHHTWPLLYRSDGQGRFFAIFAGDRMVSHCATRKVTLITADGPRDVVLLGSVATDPEYRGQGLAGQVLDHAVTAATDECDHVLLWAERPELYAHRGFVACREEKGLLLSRLPATATEGVRPAEISDHDPIHSLHCEKPWRVDRSPAESSGLLTTPGMTTLVLERNGQIAAYACCGKGADLADHWHEVGGNDHDVAELLKAALHFQGQIDAVLLLPPYRANLCDALGRSVTEAFAVPGPMAYSPRDPLPACWIDGLDSV